MGFEPFGFATVVVVFVIVPGLFISLILSLCWIQTYKKEKETLLRIFYSTFSQFTSVELKSIVIPHVYGDFTGLCQDLEEIREKLIKEKKVTESRKK